jgi:hypothetical protein
MQAAQPEPQPETTKAEVGGSALLIPVIALETLAAYNPKFGIAVGSLTLVSSAAFKKGWTWWLVGCVILVVALFFYWKDRQDSETVSAKTA